MSCRGRLSAACGCGRVGVRQQSAQLLDLLGAQWRHGIHLALDRSGQARGPEVGLGFEGGGMVGASVSSEACDTGTVMT